MTTHIAPQASVLHTGEKLLVRDGEQVHAITGQAMVSLVTQLIAATSGGVIPEPQNAEVVWNQLVTLLSESGLVTQEPGMAESSPAARLLWKRSGQAYPLTIIHEALADAVVPVIGEHPLAARIRMILQDGGITVADDPQQARASDAVEGSVAMVVVVAPSVDDPMLERFNAESLKNGTPWLPVILDDAGRSVVGPFVQPHSSACFRCYTMRRAANFPDRRAVADLTAGRALEVDGPVTDLLGLGWFIAGLAVEKVVERLALGSHSTMTRPGTFASVRRAHPGVSVEEHRVLRVPRCPDCTPTRELGLPQVWHHGGELA